MMIERVERRSFFQKVLRIFSRAKNAIDEPDFGFAVSERLLNKSDIFLVAAGVLNFAPAEPNLAFDARQ